MISVVIPTCDRPEMLRSCLSRIVGACEIVVGNDGAPFSSDSPWLAGCRVIPGPQRGPAANRNQAARVATQEWLVFVDDDCRPEPGWLAAMAKYFPEADVVEGKTVCNDRTGHALEEVVENQNGNLFWSCNLAIRRQSYFAIGGFDEDFREAAGEDLELAWRIKQHSLRCIFAADAVVLHPARRLSLKKLVYRVFQIRWHLLYRIKTGPAARPVLAELVDLLRVTWRSRSDWRPAHWLRLSMLWILSPLWCPYLLVWQRQFRRRKSPVEESSR